MRILYLGKDPELERFMKLSDTVFTTDNRVDHKGLVALDPDMIVSYNYRHILPKPVFLYPKKGTINLHTSYLPYNRGADPNIWSHIEGTPSGVTIHLIDEGIDTGPIICQKIVRFNDEMTLSTSWSTLQDEIKKLFKENFERFKSGSYETFPQNNSGATFHLSKNRPKLINGFETKIKELKANH